MQTIPDSGADDKSENIDISVLITCFNEEKSIRSAINDIVSALETTPLSWEIYVVDDASKDGSVNIVNEYISNNKHLNIHHVIHEQNRKMVPTIFETVKIARGKKFWTVAGDNTVNKDVAIKILSNIEKADIIIPNVSHYVGRSLFRKIISGSYSYIVKLISGCSVKYYNGSSIYIRSDLADVEHKVSGFAYSADSIIQLIDMGRNYVEVPVSYIERVHGKSSALTLKNLSDVARFFGKLLIWRAKREFAEISATFSKSK